MKRIQYHRYGGPEVLRLEEVPIPVPARDQIRVRLKAAAANPMDWGIRKGNVKIMTGSRFPRGLGHDFAGVIDAVGAGVTRFKVGDPVLGASGLRDAGSFAEAMVVGERLAYLKPPSVSFEQAAALTITGATAYTALVEKGRIGIGDSVFITGCLGGVGRAATQLALMRGADVTGTCSAPGREEALALGISEALDYRAFDPMRYQGRFVMVLDAAGALTPRQCDVLLKANGKAFHINNPLGDMVRFIFSSRHYAVIARDTPGTMPDLIAAAEQGKLIAKIGRIVSLSEAIPALVELETAGRPKGRLIVMP
jgi:NADPH:quinone reductase-like Zn-dependent oxidoreductase